MTAFRRIRALPIVVGSLAFSLVFSSASCNQKPDEGLKRRLRETDDQLVKVKQDKSRLQGEVDRLKRQVAQALAEPDRFILRDPEIIELIASIRGVPPAQVGQIGDELKIGKGDLNPAAASKVVMGGARALQQCYERALKKNQALQYRAGVSIILGLKVQPTGRVQEVSMTPSIDRGLLACVNNAAKRWKFPKFAGQSVTIEQKIVLTPKT